MNENTLHVEKIFKTFLNKIYFTKMSKIFCIWLYKATLVTVLAIVAQVSSVGPRVTCFFGGNRKRGLMGEKQYGLGVLLQTAHLLSVMVNC